MPIVDRGMRKQVLARTNAAKGSTWGMRQHNFKVFGKMIQQVENDMETIQKHFGVNRQAVFKVSLHMVAEAIRKGRLSL